jgi:hypothetical protein
MPATIATKRMVRDKSEFTKILSDFARRRRDACAIEKDRIMKVNTAFQISPRLTISQIAPTAIKNPRTATNIPNKAKLVYLLLS